MKMKSFARTLTAVALFTGMLLAATTARIGVKGMTCETCARGLQASLSRVPGVEKAEVHYKRQQVVVVYDSHRVTLARLRQLIAAQGFHPVKAGHPANRPSNTARSRGSVE